MIREMVVAHKFTQMVRNMWGSGKMGRNMAVVPSIISEKLKLKNGRII